MLTPRFLLGQIIHHRLFDYRGVIFDVNEDFQGSDAWYEQMGGSGPPKDQPWYRVLVHDLGYETYVAERNLELDKSGDPIRHPLIHRIFATFKDGYYELPGTFH